MALVMIILFIIVAVLGRGILQYRLTGDYGMRFSNQSPSVSATVF